MAAIVNSYGSVYVIDAETGVATLVLDEPKPTQPSFGEGYDPKPSYAKRAAPSPQISFPEEWGTPRWLDWNLFFLPNTGSYGAVIVSTSGEIVMQDDTFQIVSAAPFGDLYRVLLRNNDGTYFVFYSEIDGIEQVMTNGWSASFTPNGQSLLLQNSPQGSYTVRMDYLIGFKSLELWGSPRSSA